MFLIDEGLATLVEQLPKVCDAMFLAIKVFFHMHLATAPFRVHRVRNRSLDRRFRS